VVAQANKIVDRPPHVGIPGDMNHGIGFPTAAVELILSTYGEQLGLRDIRVQQRHRRCGRQIPLCSAARTEDGQRCLTRLRHGRLSRLTVERVLPSLSQRRRPDTTLMLAHPTIHARG
jgi:hypothetical protein